MENDIWEHGANLQALHYQNIKNELLTKGQKTSMELSGAIAANDVLEVDITNRIGTLTSL
jgi:hypothetical protein